MNALATSRLRAVCELSSGLLLNAQFTSRLRAVYALSSGLVVAVRALKSTSGGCIILQKPHKV